MSIEVLTAVAAGAAILAGVTGGVAAYEARKTRTETRQSRVEAELGRIARLLSETQQARREEIAERQIPPEEVVRLEPFQMLRMRLTVALDTLAELGGPPLPTVAELADASRELYPSESALSSQVHRALAEVRQAMRDRARSSRASRAS